MSTKLHHHLARPNRLNRGADVIGEMVLIDQRPPEANAIKGKKTYSIKDCVNKETLQ